MARSALQWLWVVDMAMCGRIIIRGVVARCILVVPLTNKAQLD